VLNNNSSLDVARKKKLKMFNLKLLYNLKVKALRQSNLKFNSPFLSRSTFVLSRLPVLDGDLVTT
jgi:hypothetical protein